MDSSARKLIISDRLRWLFWVSDSIFKKGQDIKSVLKGLSAKTCTLWIPVFHITGMNGFYTIGIFSKRYLRADILIYFLVYWYGRSNSVPTEHLYKYVRGVIVTAKTSKIQFFMTVLNNFQTWTNVTKSSNLDEVRILDKPL